MEATLPTNKFGAKVSFEDTATAFAAKTDADLYKSELLFKAIHYNWLVKTGTGFVKFALNAGFPITGLLRSTLFKQFCGGETIDECARTAQVLHKYGVGAILDYSVEGEKNEAAFDQTEQETIATIHKAAQMRDSIPFSVFKTTGLGPMPLLEKVAAKLAQPSPLPWLLSEQAGWDRLRQRVDNICRTAYEQKVRIFIDAEETWIQDAIDALAYEMMEKYNREQAIVYNTYQLYTVAGLGKLRQARTLAVKNGFYLGAKLVRGAYMEKERQRAVEKGYPDPIQPNKKATDDDFNEALRFCIDNLQRIALCAGTHNEDSCYYLAVLMEKYNISPNNQNVYFAQLHGMSDHISYNLAKAGYQVAKYLPYGPIKSVMPYLFRRAEENTSVAGQSSRELVLVSRELARRHKRK
ncbi:MAG: proline dehydrogenase family protein [Bernardetiaceae bacterium]|jgi:proline dehydrogenase|nr:proline dehydrogenase family protein [Bernardetiaceae bacterium]